MKNYFTRLEASTMPKFDFKEVLDLSGLGLRLLTL
jgi:hypothetical protein